LVHAQLQVRQLDTAEQCGFDVLLDFAQNGGQVLVRLGRIWMISEEMNPTFESEPRMDSNAKTGAEQKIWPFEEIRWI
jgi:hypothetical protein